MQTLLWRKSGVLSIAFSRKMSDEDSIFACFEPERGSHQSLDVLLDIQQPGLAFSSWKPRKHFLSRVCKFTWVEPARYPPSIHQVTLDLANRIEGVCKKKNPSGGYLLSGYWVEVCGQWRSQKPVEGTLTVQTQAWSKKYIFLLHLNVPGHGCEVLITLVLHTPFQSLKRETRALYIYDEMRALDFMAFLINMLNTLTFRSLESWQGFATIHCCSATKYHSSGDCEAAHFFYAPSPKTNLVCKASSRETFFDVIRS